MIHRTHNWIIIRIAQCPAISLFDNTRHSLVAQNDKIFLIAFSAFSGVISVFWRTVQPAHFFYLLINCSFVNVLNLLLNAPKPVVCNVNFRFCFSFCNICKCLCLIFLQSAHLLTIFRFDVIIQNNILTPERLITAAKHDILCLDTVFLKETDQIVLGN